MKELAYIKTRPKDENYGHFTGLVKQLYPAQSQRHILGHDPEDTFLSHCVVAMLDGKPVGRYAIYDNPALLYEGKSCVCIGSYECVDDVKISQALLKHAIQSATDMGKEYLIGPMEGSTWSSYRFSVDDKKSNLFMEPYHHAYYNEQFMAFGMEVIGEYVTNLDKDLGFDATQLDTLEKHYVSKGANFRHLDMERLESDLEKIGVFCLEAFSQNFLYTPIGLAEFVEKYMSYKNWFDPNLIWIVESEEGEIEALFFAIKDHLDPKGETLIIKSIATKKKSKFRGVSIYLSKKLNQIASEAGYKKIAHAFMLESNDSILASKKTSTITHQKYKLYGAQVSA